MELDNHDIQMEKNNIQMSNERIQECLLQIRIYRKTKSNGEEQLEIIKINDLSNWFYLFKSKKKEFLMANNVISMRRTINLMQKNMKIYENNLWYNDDIYFSSNCGNNTQRKNK